MSEEHIYQPLNLENQQLMKEKDQNTPENGSFGSCDPNPEITAALERVRLARERLIRARRSPLTTYKKKEVLRAQAIHAERVARSPHKD